MFSEWILETFEPNNDIYEHGRWRSKSFFVVLLSWITLRQSVDQSAFKLPWDKNLNGSRHLYHTVDLWRKQVSQYWINFEKKYCWKPTSNNKQRSFKYRPNLRLVAMGALLSAYHIDRSTYILVFYSITYEHNQTAQFRLIYSKIGVSLFSRVSVLL